MKDIHIFQFRNKYFSSYIFVTRSMVERYNFYAIANLYILMTHVEQVLYIHTYINVTQHSRKIWYAYKTRYCRVSFSFFLHVLSKLCEEQRDAINNAVREKKNEIFVRSLNLNVIVGCNITETFISSDKFVSEFFFDYVSFVLPTESLFVFNKLKKKFRNKLKFNSNLYFVKIR